VADKTKIVIESDASALAKKGADLFQRIAKESVERYHRFIVAVSGGSTPRAMHRLLSKEPYLSSIPWQRIHIFWVDERLVPYSHPDSNYGAAKQDLLDNTPIPTENRHPMPVHSAPEEVAFLYESILREFFGETMPVFDLIILGIGTDGHTASLFPNENLSVASGKSVIGVKGGNPDVYRLTLTLYVLNNARRVAFLVSGKRKADVVNRLLKCNDTRLPAFHVRPISGDLLWLLDKDAASQFSGAFTDGKT
jgi:6-phosphogluconolactonase